MAKDLSLSQVKVAPFPGTVKAKTFFEHLPYDVREMIYGYLEAEDLPPFAPGYQDSLLDLS